jgi:hypothetical protein
MIDDPLACRPLTDLFIYYYNGENHNILLLQLLHFFLDVLGVKRPELISP